eukprot:gene18829-biopygen2453
MTGGPSSRSAAPAGTLGTAAGLCSKLLRHVSRLSTGGLLYFVGVSLRGRSSASGAPPGGSYCAGPLPPGAAPARGPAGGLDPDAITAGATGGRWLTS